MKKVIIIFVIIIVAITFTVHFTVFFLVKQKMGIACNPVQFKVSENHEISNLFERIRDLDSRRFEVITAGSSSSEDLPVYVVESRNVGNEYTNRILLVGGVHGDEESGPHLLVEFLEDLARDPGLYPDIKFTVFPMVNPAGFMGNVRCNALGYDINRDFASNRTVESSILRNYTKGIGFDMVLDFHESHKKGFFIFHHQGRLGEIKSILYDLQTAGFPLVQQGKASGFDIKKGIVHIPFILSIYSRLAERAPLAHYYLFQSKFTLTIEGPGDPTAMDVRKGGGRFLLDHLLGIL